MGEHGTSAQRKHLSLLLQQHVAVLGSDAHASAVVGKALTCGSRADQADLARALISTPGLLTTMARSRHCHTAAKAVFRVLEGAEHEEACRLIYTEESSLRSSRYGQLVLSSLKQEKEKRTMRLHTATFASIGGA